MVLSKSLDTTAQVDELIQQSFEQPVVLFKHSTSCPISSIAKARVSKAEQSAALQLPVYYLDLIRHRDVSNYIASALGVKHESPQAIVVKDGQAVYNSSHLDIDPAALKA